MASDAFLVKLNALGTGLVYATYLGASGDDQAYAMATDISGNAHVVGSTDSADFPITIGAFQPNIAGRHDIFITKFNAAGSGLVYSTFLGGTGDESPGDSIALDAFAVPNLYTTGNTEPFNFPTTPGAFDSTTDGFDAIVAQISDVPTPPGPLSARVRGGGTIDVPDGVASFHFVVQRRTDGTLSGRLQYFNRETRAKVRSEVITTLNVIGNNASFDGTCTVDGAPCAFSTDVTDNGESGANDTFSISVSGGPAEGGVLRSGNISIQQ
jgi:hypothetical protein